MNGKKLSRANLQAGLANFTGTGSYTRGSVMRNLLLTDGVVWLCQSAECFWLIDAIGSHIMTNKRLQQEEFQTWTFIRSLDDYSPNRPHLLSVTDGNDTPPLARQEIEYSDFPLDEMKFFVAKDENLGGWVIMLPSEY